MVWRVHVSVVRVVYLTRKLNHYLKEGLREDWKVLVLLVDVSDHEVVSLLQGLHLDDETRLHSRKKACHLLFDDKLLGHLFPWVVRVSINFLELLHDSELEADVRVVECLGLDDPVHHLLGKLSVR